MKINEDKQKNNNKLRHFFFQKMSFNLTHLLLALLSLLFLAFAQEVSTKSKLGAIFGAFFASF
jgi:hypothetical protein